MNILLTGATGFLGRNLERKLVDKSDIFLTCLSRKSLSSPIGHALKIQHLDSDSDMTELVAGQNVIVHAAACAHILQKNSTDVIPDYRTVNVDATIKLASQAASAGCKRFVFISSIGVNGNSNTSPFIEQDIPNPQEPYAQSKWSAEIGLWEIRRNTGMEIVIIRPPLVYGSNAPGNFRSLVNWIAKGVPLPLGAIHNKRSLVAIDNLVDLIITCIDHPAAANEVFFVADGQDLSTTELLQVVAKAMGKRSRLIPVPHHLLMFCANLFGKKAVAQKLLCSLQVDISKARKLLGWEPPITVEEGLRRCFVSQDKY